VRRFRPELWRQKNWQLHHDNTPPHTSFFHLGILFTKSNITVVTHPSYFSVSSTEDKLKDRHFDTIEVIEAEARAVLNTLTEHGFQDAFKRGQKPSERCICPERDYFERNGGQ
jgi:hypothetical protein